MAPDLTIPLTVMGLNMQYGGRQNADGDPDDRWAGLVRLVGEASPDIVLLQECTDWLNWPRRIAQAEDDFELRALVAPAPSGAHTAVLFRTDRLRWVDWETRYAGQTHHGFGAAVFEVGGWPGRKLTAISAHLTPYSAAAAAQEAQLILARLFRYGGIGVMGGDINHVPLGDMEPDWSQVPPYNRSSRTVDDPVTGKVVGNAIVGSVLRSGGLTDVGAHLVPDPSERMPTGRGGVRVDQVHVTEALKPALRSYRQIKTGRASDHDATVTVLDLAAVDLDQAVEWR